MGRGGVVEENIIFPKTFVSREYNDIFISQRPHTFEDPSLPKVRQFNFYFLHMTFDRIALNVILQSPKKVKFVYFWQLFCNFLKNDLIITFVFPVYSYMYLGIILINCQEMDLIELFKRSFSRSKRSLLILFSRNEVLPKLVHLINALVLNQPCPTIWKVYNYY